MASLSVKMYKTRQCRTIFCTSHVQSVSDAVSQSVSIRVFTSSIGVRVRRYWFVLGGAVGRGVVLGVV